MPHIMSVLYCITSKGSHLSVVTRTAALVATLCYNETRIVESLLFSNVYMEFSLRSGLGIFLEDHGHFYYGGSVKTNQKKQ